MPRTKLSKKKAVPSKRNRTITSNDSFVATIERVEKELDNEIQNIKYNEEQTWDLIQRNIRNLKSKLSPEVLALKMFELEEFSELGMTSYSAVQNHLIKISGPLVNITNHTLSQSTRAGRNDDGYITGDSVSSDVSKSSRQVGPFQSAKAKSRRRSRSVTSVLQEYVSNQKSVQIMNRSKSRESRSRFRTPIGNRLQTLSADRSTGMVTPKVKAGQALAMLRYAKQGETVISLSGSPVVATGTHLLGEQANLNIPVANGMLSVKPSSDGIIDAALVRQIDDRTLKELRALAENINTIIDAKATLTG